jgi:hypothetical protein
MPESISGEAKDFLTLMLQYNPDKRISAKVTSSVFSRVPSSEVWTIPYYLTVLWIRNDFNAKPDQDAAFYINAAVDPHPRSQTNADSSGSEF